MPTLAEIAADIRNGTDALTAERRAICRACEYADPKATDRIKCALCGCDDPAAAREVCPAVPAKWPRVAKKARDREQLGRSKAQRLLLIVNGGLGDAVMVTPCALSLRSAGHDVTIWPMRGNATRLNPLWGELDGIRAAAKADIAGKSFDVVLGPTAHRVLVDRAKAFKTQCIISPQSHRGHPVDVALDMAKQVGANGAVEAQPFARLLPVKPKDAVVIGPGVSGRAEAQEKRWGGWRDLVARLVRPVFFLGLEGAGEPWMGTEPGCQSFIGQTASVADLLPILARAKCYVGVDNGLGHLAAACGIPTVTIFTATDPQKFRPYGPLSHAVKDGKRVMPKLIDRLKRLGGVLIDDSIIITTHNEGTQVRRTVESVRAASVRPPEFVVVDDASTEPEPCAGVPQPCTIIRNDEQQGVAPSRNLGVKRATGDTLFILDAHMRCADNVPQELARVAYSEDCIALAVCCPLGRPGDRFGYGAKVELHEGHIRSRWGRPKPNRTRWPVHAFVAPGWVIRRDTFHRLGGWLSGLRGWGHTEQTMSAKAFFADVPIILCADLMVEHLFRNRFPYRISPKQTWQNAYLLARALFDEDTYRLYWKPALQKYKWYAEYEAVLESPATLIEAENFQHHVKVKSDAEFFREVLDLQYPLGPLDFAQAPAALHGGTRASTVREALTLLDDRCAQPSILEIGTVRNAEDKGDGQATVAWAWYAHRRAGRLMTVDSDPRACALAKELVQSYGRAVELHHKNALEFKPETKHRVDLLYLDAWDHRRQEAAENHLAVLKNWEAHLTANALVLIDDVKTEPATGKAAAVAPYLLAKGYKVVFCRDRQCLLAKK